MQLSSNAFSLSEILFLLCLYIISTVLEAMKALRVLSFPMLSDRQSGQVCGSCQPFSRLDLWNYSTIRFFGM